MKLSLFLYDLISILLTNIVKFVFVDSVSGLNEDSKYFAHELFDVLSKRKKVEPEKGITLQQLKVFWDELTKKDLDTRLEIFFDL